MLTASRDISTSHYFRITRKREIDHSLVQVKIRETKPYLGSKFGNSVDEKHQLAEKALLCRLGPNFFK
jgi:hypothetical protein